ncbi:MAG: SDR family oxidoreductase [Anaerolineales bacterium]|nr:SDR family oxidoreductase [Anaerolineales bacterium]
MNLKGKTILISGAARRIGRILALAAARAGSDLIIHHSNSPDEAERTRQDIEKIGQEALILQSDFSDPASMDEFLAEVFSLREVFGIVNNASIFSDLSWSDTNLDQWNKHLSINLTAPFLLSQAFAKALPEDKEGRIINILDWRALRPGADHLPYTISKAGLAALTKSLAVALAPNIIVNGIAFGAILPPSNGGSPGTNLSGVQIPRWAETKEVEDTLLFLLSGPRYITGEIIHLDGGRHLS